MKKIEKIREMVRGKVVSPTFFDSDYERRNYNTKKEAINYLKGKGEDTKRLDEVINDIEEFMENATVYVKSEYDTVEELKSLPAKKVDEIYQDFLEKCRLMEYSLNTYLEKQKQSLFKLIKEDYFVDYRDIKNTDMSFLFTKDAPDILEIGVKGYGNLFLKWRCTCNGRRFLLAEYNPTKEDYENMFYGKSFLLSNDIVAGVERYNRYEALNTDYPEFIISEPTIEKIWFDGVKKLYPEKEYYYYYDEKKRGVKVLKLTENP